jgi:hypothetical protein
MKAHCGIRCESVAETTPESSVNDLRPVCRRHGTLRGPDPRVRIVGCGRYIEANVLFPWGRSGNADWSYRQPVGPPGRSGPPARCAEEV